MQKLLKVSEAAEALNVSPSTIYRMIDDKTLTKIVVNKGIRIAAAEVERINSPPPQLKAYVPGAIKRAVGLGS